MDLEYLPASGREVQANDEMECLKDGVSSSKRMIIFQVEINIKNSMQLIIA